MTQVELEKLFSDKNMQKILSLNSQKRRAYFLPLQNAFKEKVNLTPHYNKNLKVGVVIGTYGAVPYVDLQLHYLKNVNRIENVLVHDDCSPQRDDLKKLCESYGVDFYSTNENLWHRTSVGSLGDENCFFEGLKWARMKGLDILVKLSRRLVPCYCWIEGFKKLVKDTDGLTFSSYCIKDKFPIRTECIGMNVNAWASDEVLGLMNWYLKNEFPIFAEYWYNEIAREIGHYNKSERYAKVMRDSTFESSGYVLWKSLLGINRYSNEERNKNVLWHQVNSLEDYYKKSIEVFGDKYKLEDFKDIVNI